MVNRNPSENWNGNALKHEKSSFDLSAVSQKVLYLQPNSVVAFYAASCEDLSFQPSLPMQYA